MYCLRRLRELQRAYDFRELILAEVTEYRNGSKRMRAAPPKPVVPTVSW